MKPHEIEGIWIGTFSILQEGAMEDSVAELVFPTFGGGTFTWSGFPNSVKFCGNGFIRLCVIAADTLGLLCREHRGDCTHSPKLTEAVHRRKEPSSLSLTTVAKINGFGSSLQHSRLVAAFPIHFPLNHLFTYVN